MLLNFKFVLFFNDGDGVECKGWNGEIFGIGWNCDDGDILGDVENFVGRVRGDVFCMDDVFSGEGNM